VHACDTSSPNENFPGAEPSNGNVFQPSNAKRLFGFWNCSSASICEGEMIAINPTKIQPDHLKRKAYVYIRQSTWTQVQHNKESQQRQYALKEKARELGWNQVELIDEDLGRSGGSWSDRPGFRRLVAEVGLGKAGAVFSIEASRLARNNRDWYQLMDLCGLFGTLLMPSRSHTGHVRVTPLSLQRRRWG